MPAWSLTEQQLTDAQKSLCQVAMILARDLLHRDDVEVMPVVQSGDIMEDFKLWVPAADIQKLRDFWHDRRATVNSWRAA